MIVPTPIPDLPPGIHRAARDERPGQVSPSGLVARGFREVTLLYADLPDVLRFASVASPEQVVQALDGFFVAFDRAAQRHGVSRIAVVGEALAAVAGVSDPRGDHARAAAEMALEVSAAARRAGPEGRPLPVRIGLHAGPVVAAVDRAGEVREVWGESVRVARLMEAQGLPGFIQASAAAARRLAGRYRLEPRAGSRGAAAGQEGWLLTGRLG